LNSTLQLEFSSFNFQVSILASTEFSTFNFQFSTFTKRRPHPHLGNMPSVHKETPSPSPSSTEENKVVKLKFQVVKLNSTFKFDIYED